MTDENEKYVDPVTGADSTGHEWDGIAELNNPMPRWWLIVFYVTIVWAVVYWVFMPAWPGLSGYTQGLRGHTERQNVAIAIEALKADRAADAAELTQAPNLAAIKGDEGLFQFALALGESAFGDNCATCHGAGGQGFKGYPNLVDDAWLWGGSLDAIKHTLTVGIRSEHPEMRFSQMPAFGRDGVLDRDQVSDVVDYVLSLSGQDADPAAAERGAVIFEEQCVVCHMEGGVGNRDLGAPNLADAIWLYGGDRADIRETIWNSRYGVMPSWEARLDDATISALAVYVHALGGGE
ncbi:MAG: cytochrome-c oxidase, cbb3-type subunit III [Pseudomonadota bacterium]